MLHFIAFSFFTALLLTMLSGISFLLIASREKIERALRLGQTEVQPLAPKSSRIRVLRTAGGRRFTSPLRAAA